jgi:hypothetical protein
MLGGDAQCGIEAERHVGAEDVVVDGLGQGHHVEPLLVQAERVLLRAAAAKADEGVEVVVLVALDDDVGHVQRLAAHQHPVGLVTAGAEDGAAHGQDARELRLVEVDAALLHQATEAVAEADDAHVVGADGGLAHATDGGVEAGAVAAGGEDPDGLAHGPHLRGASAGVRAASRRSRGRSPGP